MAFRGTVYVVLAALLNAFTAYFGVKVMDAQYSVSTMLFWRFFIAALVLAPVVIVLKAYRKHEVRDILFAFFIGAFFFTPCSVLYFYASQAIGTGLSMVIFFMYPAIILLINHFVFNKKIAGWYYFSIAISLIGMTFFIDLSAIHADLMGVGVALTSAFFYAIYLMTITKTSLSALMSALMVSLGAIVSSALLSYVNHDFNVPHHWGTVFNLLGMGIIASAIPLFFLLKGLTCISTEKTSMISVIEPVFVVIIGFCLLDEAMHLTQLIGIIIVLSGVFCTAFYHKLKAEQLRVRNPMPQA